MSNTHHGSTSFTVGVTVGVNRIISGLYSLSHSHTLKRWQVQRLTDTYSKHTNTRRPTVYKPMHIYAHHKYTVIHLPIYTHTHTDTHWLASVSLQPSLSQTAEEIRRPGAAPHVRVIVFLPLLSLFPTPSPLTPSNLSWKTLYQPLKRAWLPVVENVCCV